VLFSPATVWFLAHQQTHLTWIEIPRPFTLAQTRFPGLDSVNKAEKNYWLRHVAVRVDASLSLYLQTVWSSYLEIKTVQPKGTMRRLSSKDLGLN
jgi:hypothetical protein